MSNNNKPDWESISFNICMTIMACRFMAFLYFVINEAL